MKNSAMKNSAVENTAVKSTAARYGEKIRFSKGAPINFEDFNLTYTGQRIVGIEKPVRQFVYYDFKAEAGSEQQIVSWSSGLGEIAPTQFEIGGKKYELELRISDKLGNLAENELVIWKKQ